MTIRNVGDKVVVNKSNKTIIYTIDQLVNGSAILKYKSGLRWVGGGSMPVTCLMTPTKAQMEQGHGQGI